MRRALLLLAAVLLAPGLPAPALAAARGSAPVDAGVPIMRFADVRAGMTGHGLSVFHGWDVERFGVEVIGKIANRFPDQGIILVRLSGQGLERSRTVAGMSGSPVYLDGKLAGAIAFAWSFAMDPIAGVTPIESMLEEMGRTTQPLREQAWNDEVRRIWDPYVAGGSLAEAIKRFGGSGATPAGAGGAGMAAVATPISLPALPPDMAAEFREGLGALGMVAVTAPAAGVSAGRSKVSSGGPSGVKPGSALGVGFLLGDLTMAGVGTVTHVVGNRLTGFGHPFFQVGPTDFPILDSEVITVLPTQAVSFKMSAAGPEVGQLVGDFQASVVGRLDRRSELVDLRVRVRARDLNVDRVYKMRAAPNPLLLPMVIAAGVGGTLAHALPHGLPYYYKVGVAWESHEGLKDRYTFVTLSTNVKGSAARVAISPLIRLLGNPFARIHLSAISIDVEAIPEARVAHVIGAATPATEVRAGAEVPVRVTLLPFGADAPVQRVLRLKIPRRLAGRTVTLHVGPGNKIIRPMVPAPVDLQTYLDALRPVATADELALGLEVPEAVLDAGGVLYPSAPPSLLASVAALSVRLPKVRVRPGRVVVRTRVDWVLVGGAKLRLDVLPPLP